MGLQPSRAKVAELVHVAVEGTAPAAAPPPNPGNQPPQHSSVLPFLMEKRASQPFCTTTVGSSAVRVRSPRPVPRKFHRPVPVRGPIGTCGRKQTSRCARRRVPELRSKQTGQRNATPSASAKFSMLTTLPPASIFTHVASSSLRLCSLRPSGRLTAILDCSPGRSYRRALPVPRRR